MLSMRRWNPFEELTGLHREMDRVFGRYVGDERAGAPETAWIPATEIDRGDEGWRVRVALPGIDPEDVHIDLHGNSLTVTGERTRTGKDGPGGTSEFHYGRFERAFTLPANVDTEKVSADYVHGVLELTLPLAETAKPRRIAIGAGERAA
jgi:HSP20 family protein